MNYRKVNIIELPTNLGLKKSAREVEPGVKKAPEWLEKWGLHQALNPIRVDRLNPPEYSMDWDDASGVRNADKIIQYAREQSELLKRRLGEPSLLLMIGGDCSILIGSAMALKELGNFGLFFLDGHTDFIGPELSQTGGAAGMDLAIVTGHGHDKLTGIHSLKPYFIENNVYCAGNREYDAQYVEPVLHADIHYLDLKALRKNGLANTAKQFLEMVEAHHLDGFLIHIDVDVLHDTLMPSVDSRQSDGLSYQEFLAILKPLFLSEKIVGVEVTILDPDLDQEGKYTKMFVKNFLSLFEITDG